MDTIEYWKLSKRVTIFQVAMLIMGVNPEIYTSDSVNALLHGKENSSGYGAIKNALIEAVRDKKLKAEIVEETTTNDGERYYPIEGTVDIDRTYVGLLDIEIFLEDRNFKSNFFSSQQKTVGYLDPDHACYAPKLAAAVSAWLAVTNEGKHETEGTPKRLMEKWLRENAARYGLTKPDGNPNGLGIEEITKVANWKMGGASKTPSIPPDSSGKPSHPKKTKTKAIRVGASE